MRIVNKVADLRSKEAEMFSLLWLLRASLH